MGSSAIWKGEPHNPHWKRGDFLSPAQVVQAEAAEAKATAEANLAGSTKAWGRLAEGVKLVGQLWNLKGTSPSSPRKDGLGMGGGKGPLDFFFEVVKYHPKLTGKVGLLRKKYRGLVPPLLLMNYCMNFYVDKTIWLPNSLPQALHTAYICECL